MLSDDVDVELSTGEVVLSTGVAGSTVGETGSTTTGVFNLVW